MTSEPGRAEGVCPLCGAGNPPGATHCSSCGRTFGQSPLSTNPYEAPKTPLAPEGTLGQVVAYLVGTVLIFLSTVIAFVATCFPIGLVSLGNDSLIGIGIALLAGLAAAGVTLTYSTRLFKRMMRRREKGSP